MRIPRGLLHLLGFRCDDDVVIVSENILYKERIDCSGMRLFPPTTKVSYDGEELTLAVAASLIGTLPERLVELANSGKLKSRWLPDGTLRFERTDLAGLIQARISVASTKIEPSIPTSRVPARIGETVVLPSPLSVARAEAPVPPEGGTGEVVLKEDSPFAVRRGHVTQPVIGDVVEMSEGRNR